MTLVERLREFAKTIEKAEGDWHRVASDFQREMFKERARAEAAEARIAQMFEENQRNGTLAADLQARLEELEARAEDYLALFEKWSAAEARLEQAEARIAEAAHEVELERESHVAHCEKAGRLAEAADALAAHSRYLHNDPRCPAELADALAAFRGADARTAQ